MLATKPFQSPDLLTESFVTTLSDDFLDTKRQMHMVLVCFIEVYCCATMRIVM